MRTIREIENDTQMNTQEMNNIADVIITLFGVASMQIALSDIVTDTPLLSSISIPVRQTDDEFRRLVIGSLLYGYEEALTIPGRTFCNHPDCQKSLQIASKINRDNLFKNDKILAAVEKATYIEDLPDTREILVDERYVKEIAEYTNLSDVEITLLLLATNFGIAARYGLLAGRGLAFCLQD